MIIAHFKQTPIANAPEAVSDVINKYTDHNSYVVGYGYPNKKLITLWFIFESLTYMIWGFGVLGYCS